MLTTSVANQSVTFEIPGEAVPWRVPKQDHRYAKIVTFTDDELREFKGRVTTLARRAMKDARLKPFDGAVLLYVRVIRDIPASFSAKRRQQAINGEIWPLRRPDLSNLIKGVEDGMNGEVYTDDARICGSMTFKVYGEVPRTIISVQTL